MGSKVAVALTVACLLAAPLSARAGSEDGARVYTNADLERLEPIPTQQGAAQTPEDVARGWDFVQSVLDQAYARVDAERSHELERRRTEAEANALDRVASEPHYTLPYAYGGLGAYGYGYGYGGYGYGHGHPGMHAGRGRGEWEHANLFHPITPIYARPHPESLFRFPARGPAHARR